jgi:3-dehydroquinate dehydratase-2
VDLVHSAREEEVKCIIINPGALTHSSIALRDALSGVGIPFIEIHISNIYAREDFRQVSYLSDIAQGVISGLGIEGYELALKTAFKKFK